MFKDFLNVIDAAVTQPGHKGVRGVADPMDELYELFEAGEITATEYRIAVARLLPQKEFTGTGAWLTVEDGKVID